MRSAWAMGLLAAAVIGSAACGPVGPSKNATETFSGTLQPAVDTNYDYKEFPFNASKNGEYSVTLGPLSPVANVFMHVWFGIPDSLNGCATILNYTYTATPGQLALSGAIDKGTWCVGIQDEGSIKQPENFVLTVSHP